MPSAEVQRGNRSAQIEKKDHRLKAKIVLRLVSLSLDHSVCESFIRLYQSPASHVITALSHSPDPSQRLAASSVDPAIACLSAS
jgi:hypothetical protein